MKLIYTFTVELPLKDLSSYEGDETLSIKTIHEAAALEQDLLRSGTLDPIDVLCNCEAFTCTVIGVE
jgi:uncharacterized ParB-like nuclease family protein